MPVSPEQVRYELEKIEPDYQRIAALGPEALTHLESLIQSDDPQIAPKAAYAASLVGHERGSEVVERAAASDDVKVRVAAAAALRNLEGEAAGGPLRRLLSDDDGGVRATAVRSMPQSAPAELWTLVATIAESDPDPSVSRVARRTLGRRGRGGTGGHPPDWR